jgi:aminoglycoside phosphotransferase
LRGGRVEKTYVGADGAARARTEAACLAALADRLPVPGVVLADPARARLTLEFLPGEHGQDLIDRGDAPLVLRRAGEALAALQRAPVPEVTGLDGDGPVVVHGDFGPQNLLVDRDAGRVTGVLDWEFAHRGAPVEDLAWAEWIVRTHHPRSVDALDDLFAGAGVRPSWTQRHDAMLRRVRGLLDDAERSGSPSPWRARLDATESWPE